MNVARTSILVALIAAAALSVGTPKFVKDFKGAYNPKAEGTLAKANCMVCHVGKTAKLNPYGADLKVILEREKTKALTAALLKKADGLDSDKDGVANLKEIQADTLPGDPKSK